MDITTLQQAQRQAHAAWSAAPERSRAEKARKAELAAALSAACTAVAAAKRATLPAVEVSQVAISRAAAKSAAAAEAEPAGDLRRRVVSAAGRYMDGCASRADAQLLAEYGDAVLGEGWEQ